MSLNRSHLLFFLPGSWPLSCMVNEIYVSKTYFQNAKFWLASSILAIYLNVTQLLLQFLITNWSYIWHPLHRPCVSAGLAWLILVSRHMHIYAIPVMAYLFWHFLTTNFGQSWWYDLSGPILHLVTFFLHRRQRPHFCNCNSLQTFDPVPSWLHVITVVFVLNEMLPIYVAWIAYGLIFYSLSCIEFFMALRSCCDVCFLCISSCNNYWSALASLRKARFTEGYKFFEL